MSFELAKNCCAIRGCNSVVQVRCLIVHVNSASTHSWLQQRSSGTMPYCACEFSISVLSRIVLSRIVLTSQHQLSALRSRSTGAQWQDLLENKNNA